MWQWNPVEKKILKLHSKVYCMIFSSLSLNCLWSEICFCLVLKFTLSNARFQSLRRLPLKVMILQAFKVEPFCLQKRTLNRAVKIPRGTNLWRHFGAKIVLTMADRKELPVNISRLSETSAKICMCYMRVSYKMSTNHASQTFRFVSRVALARIVTLSCDASVYVWFHLMMNDDGKILALRFSYPTSPQHN